MESSVAEPGSVPDSDANIEGSVDGETTKPNDDTVANTVDDSSEPSSDDRPLVELSDSASD